MFNVIVAIVLSIYAAWLCVSWINLIRQKAWYRISDGIFCTAFLAVAVFIVSFA